MAIGYPRQVVDVVVLGATAEAPPPGLPETASGATYRFVDDEPALRAVLPAAEVIFHWDDRTAALRAAWPLAERLRWIHASGIGVEWTIFPELLERDVALTNCRGVFDRTIPEYILGMMLALAKDLVGTLAAQREHRWVHRPVSALDGGRAVIVGSGSIGRATARMLRTMGLRVTLVARTDRDDPEFGAIVAAGQLREVVADADWVIVIAPLTAETRGLVDASVLKAMPPNARLINVGRGPVVDGAALVAALREGAIAGAALDVFDREPLPPEDPFWSMPNVIVSPHMAGDVHGWLAWFTDSFLANLRRWQAGQALENVVDLRLGYVHDSGRHSG
jgi:phosphoglycerate dehydrogenase-like enzyme